MKFEEKVKYFKDGELSAQTMFRFYKGYISKANEIIADCYRDDWED